MADMYQKVEVNGVDEDHKQIVNIYDRVFKCQLENDVNLLNYYYELPISHGASIEDFSRHKLKIFAHPAQVVAIKASGETIIRTKHLPYAVLGKLVEAGAIDGNRITVSIDSFVEVRAERRSSVRVRALDQVKVLCAEKQFSGLLYDISLGGISVVCEKQSKLKAGDTIKLTVKMLLKDIVLGATLVRTFEDDGKFRYHFQVRNAKNAEEDILQLISNQQLKIIRRIKDESD